MHRPTPPPPPPKKIPHFSLSSHKVPHLSPSLLHNSLGLQLTSKGKGGQCRGNKGSADRRFGFLSLSLSLTMACLQQGLSIVRSLKAKPPTIALTPMKPPAKFNKANLMI